MKKLVIAAITAVVATVSFSSIAEAGWRHRHHNWDGYNQDWDGYRHHHRHHYYDYDYDYGCDNDY
jgi:sterol desaturase/sphingolipid hydroxylase (fatty acid hydroxylase superfamily)